MVHPEQPVIRAIAAAGQGDEVQEVIVEAELQGLGLGGLAHRVEGGGLGQHRVAPADDVLNFIALSHRIGLRHLVVQFGEGEGAGAAGHRDFGGLQAGLGDLRRGIVDQLIGQGGHGPGSGQAAQCRAARQTGGHHFGDCGAGVGIAADIFDFVAHGHVLSWWIVTNAWCGMLR